MPDVRLTQIFVDEVNVLGADPKAAMAHPHWPDLQEEGCLDILPGWIAENLEPESVAHLNDDVPAHVKEGARRFAVGCIERGQPVALRLDTGGEWGVRLDTAFLGQQFITVQIPAVAQPV